MKTKLFLILCVLFFIGLSSCKNNAKHKAIYVSLDGDDANPGTSEQPFATISKAKMEAQKDSTIVDVIIRGGTYYLSEPLQFNVEDSRTEKSPLTFKSHADEKVVISGAKPLKLSWSEYKSGIWMAKVDADIIFDQLYVNGLPQRMARFPNYDANAQIFGGTDATVIIPERVAKWQNPKGGIVHSIHPREWGSYHYLILGKEENNEVILERKIEEKVNQYSRLTAPLHTKYLFVENVFEELDTEKEWFYDKKTKTIYYYPPKGLKLADANLEFPQIESLITFKGTEKEPIKNIRFEGLTFTHTLRTFYDTSEKMSRGDWLINRIGTIFMEGTENCEIEKCTFSELGGNAVFVNSFNRGVEISSSLFKNLGASAVCFAGHADSRYPFHISMEEMASHPGPKTNNYPSESKVKDNLMYNLGTIEKQVAGVHISMAKNISVSHNTIYDVPRAGINVNDGMWGGHIIEFNDVFNTVLETADHGAFNSWGRDHDYFRDGDTLALKYRDKKAGFSMLSPIIIRNNRFRCDHGWDIDLDDGSQNYHIYNNLLLSGGLKLREGFFRTVENNIIINNSFHPHVWHANSDDVFTRNIVTTGYYPIGMPKKWTKLIDNNIFLDSLSSIKAKVDGRDLNSIYNPADFVNPAEGDYRLKENAPAFSIGFKNFDMDKFGVVSEKLKVLAKKPLLPELISFVYNANEIITISGMQVKSVGLGERSATGMFAEKGVYVVAVDEQSKYFDLLQSGDVILEYNSEYISNDISKLSDFQKAVLQPNFSASIKIHVHRRGKGMFVVELTK